ncbi:MAG: 4Fe-4S dicluster domain-containing protein [Smithellaceae bacterium]|nr:4Fe-4S dicluster domain-containing protein [Smithellaceae bacterium]
MMNQTATAVAKENDFLHEVMEASGEDLNACYQCQKCSAGCPVAFAMDILPSQMMRRIQYGQRDLIFSSRTIWLCASCHACSARCPNDIDIARIMDTLRHLAFRAGAPAGEKEIPVFHQAFLDTIKSYGRIHEISMIVRYKNKTRDFFKDAALGWNMFRRGKIKLLPATFSGGREIKDIFKTFEKGEKK